MRYPTSYDECMTSEDLAMSKFLTSVDRERHIINYVKECKDRDQYSFLFSKDKFTLSMYDYRFFDFVVCVDTETNTWHILKNRVSIAREMHPLF